MRVGSLIIAQGFYSGSGAGAKCVQLSSNSNVPTMVTSTSQYSSFLLYGRYLDGANGTIRFYRGGSNGLSGSTIYTDINKNGSGNHILQIYGQVGSGQTLTLEHLTISLIY